MAVKGYAGFVFNEWKKRKSQERRIFGTIFRFHSISNALNSVLFTRSISMSKLHKYRIRLHAMIRMCSRTTNKDEKKPQRNVPFHWTDVFGNKSNRMWFCFTSDYFSNNKSCISHSPSKWNGQWSWTAIERLPGNLIVIWWAIIRNHWSWKFPEIY